jgi:6-phosphogluconate dehydrogenase
MKYKVYYFKLDENTAHEFVHMHLSESRINVTSDKYDYVAEVEAENAQDIFIMLNNDEITKEPQLANLRSMMVGDIVIDSNNKGYICRPIGWQEFEPELCGFSLSGK